MKIKKLNPFFVSSIVFFLISLSQKTYGVDNEAGEYWLWNLSFLMMICGNIIQLFHKKIDETA